MIFYRSLYATFKLILLMLRPFLKGKIRTGLDSRSQRPWRHIRVQNAVWIHCSSGEFEYARPLIRALKKRKEKVIVSYFSPSVEPRLKRQKNIDAYFIAPWDDPKSLHEFLETSQPKALLIARTDLWPEMIYQCKKHSVPIQLFSFTLGDSSSKLGFWGRQTFAPILEKIDLIHCVSERDQENLKKITTKTKNLISGDTRYDQVIHRVAHPEKEITPFVDNKEQMTVVFASVWPEDWEALKQAVPKLLPSARVAVVPHEVHPEFLEQLQQSFEKCQLHSSGQPWDSRSVLILDQVGWLADFYLCADVVFVGGSFRAQVHSVMESLAHGCFTLVGPYYKNNREACEFMEDTVNGIAPVQKVESAQDLLDKIGVFQEQNLQAFKSQLKKKVNSKSGASLAVLEHI